MKQCEGPPSRRRVDDMATSKGINMLSNRIAVVYAVVCVGLVGLTPAHADTSQEAAFLAENQAAMDKMMAGMNIKPTGNVDHDFTAMMIPHHQGAIDMAQAELQYGHNQQLTRIAQEIVVEQLQEIAAMRLAIGEPASPTWVTNGAHDTPAAAPSHKANPGGDAPVFKSIERGDGQDDDRHGREAHGRY